MTVYCIEMNREQLPLTGRMVGFLNDDGMRERTRATPGITLSLFSALVPDEKVVVAEGSLALFEAEEIITSKLIDQWQA